jgi:hypothetical protein
MLEKTGTGVVQSPQPAPVAEIENAPTPPPDGGYGWVCLACCFTINCFTWGIVAVSHDVVICALLQVSTPIIPVSSHIPVLRRLSVILSDDRRVS